MNSYMKNNIKCVKFNVKYTENLKKNMCQLTMLTGHEFNCTSFTVKFNLQNLNFYLKELDFMNYRFP